MTYRSKRTRVVAASVSNDVTSDSAAPTTSRSPAMITTEDQDDSEGKEAKDPLN
ncbi:hypothetical protein BVRB_002060 [Beta vulgaris subsp. vulgaris]|uniref:Uncharacterized protein n=1 Tax=Beta vulgaris subsp. vulgaris TaxID=3555 RepID=A0A0J8B4I3_BETVV|nr:hypothetical protein BVRB_002060 [Beta vulgaris subsp. vulgaris]